MCARSAITPRSVCWIGRGWKGGPPFIRRHLLQLVAIKRLQARGLSLAQVQARLLNASDAELASLAELPADFVPSNAPPRNPPTQAAHEPRPAPNRQFWKAPPAAAASPAASDSPGELPRTFAGIPLAADVSLLLESPRLLDEQDVAALQAAAQPLLELLRQRGLLSERNSS